MWMMEMCWHDLLFMHWPMAPELIRRLLPPELELDCWEGQAYLGLVPFRMSGIRLRGTPPLPGLSAFPEMNIRTYVRKDGRSGVWFFSLDAMHRLAVATARATFALPYFNARMSCRWERGWCRYENRRDDGDASFRARYRPTGEPFQSRPGTLEHWLTERYFLFSQRSSGQLLCGPVWHHPWWLQPAQAQVEDLDMVDWLGLRLGGEPLLHFSQMQRVRAGLVFAAGRRSERPLAGT